MIDRIMTLWPEITLFTGVVLVLLLGLTNNNAAKRAVPLIAALVLIIASLIASQTRIETSLLPGLAPFMRTLIGVIAFFLLILNSGVVRLAGGDNEDPEKSFNAEYYAFFLLSVMGVMLTTTATDLIWLFLALELTSLPTYIMVATSTKSSLSREAGVKYFFLGAFGAAIFLYGFALLYGGSGSLKFADMAAAFQANGINGLAITGLIVSLIGVSFKIAAVPMHLYTPDVYQGAATPVSAFLAFMPKTAGFVAILLLVSTVNAAGLPVPHSIQAIIVAMAAVTMTVGNVLGTLQKDVKRILAYSSIAHSGYMLIGIAAGTGDGSIFSNGYAAVVFYLLCYGVMNLGAFGVLASLERNGSEIETVADLKGLCRTNPLMGWTMVICAGSLMGLPPLLGFFGKLYLFAVGINNGLIALVIVAGINSAIAAFYYLKMAVPPIAHEPTEESRNIISARMPGRILVSSLSALSVILLVLAVSPLVRATGSATAVNNELSAAQSSEQKTAGISAPVVIGKTD